MLRDLIFIVALVVVLFIVWLALKMNIRVRKARASEIKGINLAGYVTFINNFKKGEEAEGRGNRQEAIRCFRRALSSLRSSEDSDELVKETEREVSERIASLEREISGSKT